MGRKRAHTPEEIVPKLRQAEVLVGHLIRSQGHGREQLIPTRQTSTEAGKLQLHQLVGVDGPTASRATVGLSTTNQGPSQ